MQPINFNEEDLLLYLTLNDTEGYFSRTQEEIYEEANSNYKGLSNLHYNVDLNVFQFVAKSLIALTENMPYFRLPTTSDYKEFYSCEWREMLNSKYDIQSIADLVKKLNQLSVTDLRCIRAITWALALYGPVFGEEEALVSNFFNSIVLSNKDIYLALASLRYTQSSLSARDLLDKETRLHSSITEVALAMESATSEEQISNFLNIVGNYAIDCLEHCKVSAIENNYKSILFITDKFISLTTTDFIEPVLCLKLKKLSMLTKSACKTQAIKSLANFGFTPALVLKLNILFSQETNVLQYKSNNDLIAINAIEQLLIYGGTVEDFRLALRYISYPEDLCKVISKQEEKPAYAQDFLAALGMHHFNNDAIYNKLVKKTIESFNITFNDKPKVIGYELSILDILTMTSLQNGCIDNIWDWISKDYFNNFIAEFKDSQYARFAARLGLTQNAELKESNIFFDEVRKFDTRQDLDSFWDIVKKVEAGYLDAKEIYANLIKGPYYVYKIHDLIKFNTDFMSDEEIRDLVKWHIECYKKFNLSLVLILATLMCIDSSLDNVMPEIAEQRGLITESLKDIKLPYQVNYLFSNYQSKITEQKNVEPDDLDDEVYED